MNTDVFFTQGSTHRMCEDYALANETQVVVSDGCSSAAHTDFGARLIAAAAMQCNRQSLPCKERWGRILASADIFRKAVGLPIESLCATLLTACESECEGQPSIAVDIIGDGTIMARRREDKSFDVYNVNYPSGAPYYLRYNISDADQKKWGEQFGWTRKITHWKWHPEWSGPTDCTQVVQDQPRTDIIADFYQFPIAIYDLVVLTSDGAQSFCTSTENGDTLRISLFEILKEVLTFKNTRAEFVHKRCVKAFRQFKENRWENFDDFSLGAIAVGE